MFKSMLHRLPQEISGWSRSEEEDKLGNVSGIKHQSGTVHVETDYTLFQILLQSSKLSLQPPKNSKTVLMKKKEITIFYLKLYTYF